MCPSNLHHIDHIPFCSYSFILYHHVSGLNHAKSLFLLVKPAVKPMKKGPPIRAVLRRKLREAALQTDGCEVAQQVDEPQRVGRWVMVGMVSLKIWVNYNISLT